jgi:hypothetical protein
VGGVPLWTTPKFGPPLTSYRFAEVYWADLPRGLVEKKYTLEETKAWARTVLGRFQSRRVETPPSDVAVAVDPELVATALDEMIDGIRVLDRLFFIGEKAGVVKFELGPILMSYLGDVQVVTEFERERLEIIKRFTETMENVAKDDPNVEIYVVGHSEGSVVAFLGLLTAAKIRGTPPVPGKKDDRPAAWLENVRGFMTIGSPIDKHLVLWPELWDPVSNPDWKPKTKIHWKNYYDYGDPVGFELEYARKDQIPKRGWSKLFKFEQEDDHGFGRYPLPGKAHNDYWTDDGVFGHFLKSVVDRDLPPNGGKTYKQAPQSKKRWQVLSYVLPYVLAAVVLTGAVYVGFRGVVRAFIPQPPEVTATASADAAAAYRGSTAASQPGQSDRAARREARLAAQHPWRTVAGVGLTVGALVLLLTGMIVFSRVYCLTNRRWRRFIYGAFGLVVGVAGYAVCSNFASKITYSPLGPASEPFKPLHGLWSPTLPIIAIILAILSGVAARRWPRSRLIPLLAAAIVITAITLWIPINQQDLDLSGPLWPALLGGVAFVYLLWLAILLFDLTFIWHRYIRFALAMQVACGLKQGPSSGGNSGERAPRPEPQPT